MNSPIKPPLLVQPCRRGSVRTAPNESSSGINLRIGLRVPEFRIREARCV
jgi:hypothetical protein